MPLVPARPYDSSLICLCRSAWATGREETVLGDWGLCCQELTTEFSLVGHEMGISPSIPQMPLADSWSLEQHGLKRGSKDHFFSQ